MEKIISSNDLMDHMSNMNKENSVYQINIPGKGTFTIVLQEEEKRTIAADAKVNPDLKDMIQESMEAYNEGRTITTKELKQSLSPKDFYR